jgi:hypothetical protein
VDPSRARPQQPVAIAYGVTVHAAVRVHGNDRAQLERICGEYDSALETAAAGGPAAGAAWVTRQQQAMAQPDKGVQGQSAFTV